MTQAAPTTSDLAPNERLEELLQAAAICFEQRGYAATSIDAVARFMGATKGRVYHYFPSKLDLFNAVRERGMEIVFEATDPGYHADLPAVDRLTLMALGHVRAMLLHHSFMQVHKEGLQMHRYGATTPEQREATLRHIERRDAYEARFREVVREGAKQGALTVGEPFGITIQSFLSALHGPVTWYFPRPDDTPEKLESLAREVVRFAMQGLGHTITARDWARLTQEEERT
ncbi:TetR/AcrR family transcriptional regulator [Jhaorihella thermophila]|uniref:DNA-binding transcriptional regulator, AcrR family n=1 Tax=Jhaorihella thermophila TaxID=488547 RepID=A0A1H5VJD6_9RHOB|nr:TetR/AcrR family transcriptional regulator [Jhaorihella thermophila]SEF87303.1 DNA-binding transcriptional regulator, AcrR family [Jhaorihella thermophila]